MKLSHTLALCSVVAVSSFSHAADLAGLAAVKSKADLDSLIVATSDAALKQALSASAEAILEAVEMRPHVEAVVHTIEQSPGKVEKINTTPEGLKLAAGGDVSFFDTLKAVDLSIPNAGPHDARKTDPYDAAFFEHLGHISSLESINIIATKANDEWIAPLGKLTKLKVLRFTNNGKLSDVGLEKLAGLHQLENFSFVGTGMKGHAFAKFEGWTNLKSSSYRGSSIDDEGLGLLCSHFPNLESISLAHAKFTDAGAVNFVKLSKLKGLEIGAHDATPQTLQNLAKLPLEYLQLGEGFDSPACIPLIQSFANLKRLTITNAKAYKPADVKLVASMHQLESLEFSDLDASEECLEALKGLTHLKALRLVHRPKPYEPEIQAKIKALLPHTALKFD